MCGTIHFYGERGLVNAMFLDLRAKQSLAIFLRAIEFPFRETKHLDIPEGSNITVIVEAGFGGSRTGFGWPDAVISARTPKAAHFVLLCEAKAGLYSNEAEDFTSTRAAGFNSTINGQFSLRYRLAEALRSSSVGLARLIEHEDLARAYGEEKLPRRLAKKANLRNIVDPHLLGATEYLFVALTDDDNSPWQVVEKEAPKMLPFLSEPLPPDSPSEPWTVERNTWHEQNERFGWIGFKSVEPLVEGGDYFPLARKFLDAKRRPAAAGLEPGVPIRPRSWNDALRPASTIALRDRLRQLIRDEAAVLGLRYEPGKGSDSAL